MGKTAIVEGLAQRIVHQDVPDTLPRRLIALDMGALVGKIEWISNEYLSMVNVFSRCKSSR